MSLDFQAIGKRIKNARKTIGMSQGELASKINISVSAISLFEKGERKIKLETLSKIANHLHVSMKEIVEGYESPPEYITFRANSGKIDTKTRKVLDKLLHS